ncbi:MAG: prepilin-type N-terminal cleavage/methylation domain-containing protein [Deltaproteobacteria bacterium]|nr:prepilin-type N-terminal cleavage/methylation domain-containing protein [Deltaproteobacteria bacterium]
MTRNEKGLTFIELLAVVAIVAILAAVSVVSYRSYMVRARLQDAKVALETVRAEEEQYRAEFGHYCAPNSLNFFGGAAQVDVGDYRIQFTSQNQTNYRVQADPQTVRQSFARNSKYGGWISINQNGDRDHQPGGQNRWP